jgi:hypothetical protein
LADEEHATTFTARNPKKVERRWANEVVTDHLVNTGKQNMKALLAVIIAATSASTLAIAEPTAPADKKDSGSLSSGAKDSSPATANQGENTRVGQEPSTSQTNDRSGGTSVVPGTKKGMGTSDPTGVENQ